MGKKGIRQTKEVTWQRKVIRDEVRELIAEEKAQKLKK